MLYYHPVFYPFVIISSQTSPPFPPSSAGVGRTGTFITIDHALQQAQEEGRVDIVSIITKLRKQRMKMVQTLVSTAWNQDREGARFIIPLPPSLPPSLLLPRTNTSSSMRRCWRLPCVGTHRSLLQSSTLLLRCSPSVTRRVERQVLRNSFK